MRSSRSVESSSLGTRCRACSRSGRAFRGCRTGRWTAGRSSIAPSTPAAMTAPELVADALRAALYGAEPVVARLPQSALDPIARAAAWLGDEREMRAELEALFGDRPIPPGVIEEARALAIRNELEVLRYRRLDARTIDRTCVLEGGEHLDAALARGRGAIVATAHFGAHQLVMPALGYRGYVMHQLSAPPPVWAELTPGSELR